MGKEKQIEEMLNEICIKCTYLLVCEDEHLKQVCRFAKMVNILYDAGYRKQIEAEWITDEKGYVTCSNCGEEHTWDEFRPTYCDMCGAKMKGGAE